MTPEERLEILLAEIEKEFKGKVVIEEKSEKWYWRVLGFLHKYVLTFGKNDKFMETVTTVMGPRIGLPGPVKSYRAEQLYEKLMHERVHHRQMARWSKNLWVGAFFHMLMYAFVFFPLGLAYMRAEYEKEAYAETIRAWIQLYGYQEVVGVNAEAYKNFVVGVFSSSTYWWMWPFRKSNSKWYDETVRRIAKEEGVL